MCKQVISSITDIFHSLKKRTMHFKSAFKKLFTGIKAKMAPVYHNCKNDIV